MRCKSILKLLTNTRTAIASTVIAVIFTISIYSEAHQVLNAIFYGSFLQIVSIFALVDFLDATDNNNNRNIKKRIWSCLPVIYFNALYSLILFGLHFNYANTSNEYLLAHLPLLFISLSLYLILKVSVAFIFKIKEK